MYQFIRDIKEAIKLGEGLHIEFKDGYNNLPNSIYETICAFANTRGGSIYIGIDDNKNITNIPLQKLETYKQDIYNTLNNKNKIYPVITPIIEIISEDTFNVLCIHIAESSQVHICNKDIFVRRNEGDFRITEKYEELSNLYWQKKQVIFDATIFPKVEINDLKSNIIDRARQMALNLKANHLWAGKNNIDMLKSASLYQKNYKTGEEGFTLASILLFGKDEVIKSILPYYEIDLIVKFNSKNRYDDRIVISGNIIEAYDTIIEFIRKYLPDKFYLNSNTQRVSIRDIIFREIVINMLIHRDYSQHKKASIIVEKNMIHFENPNQPMIYGQIDLDYDFFSYAKNPLIADFCRNIGLAEKLGTGLQYISNHYREYSNNEPVINDSYIFSLSWEVETLYEDYIDDVEASDQVTDQVQRISDQATDQLSDQVSDQVKLNRIIEFCTTEKSINEIMEHFGYSNKTYFRNNILTPIIEKGLLKTVYDKPNHPLQKYISDQVSDQVTDQVQRVSDQVSDQVDLNKIIEFCSTEKSINEIMEHFGYSNKTYFRNNILTPIIEKGLLKTVYDKPNHPRQKYIKIK